MSLSVYLNLEEEKKTEHFMVRDMWSGYHYANMPMLYAAIFKGCKNDKFLDEKICFISHFCSIHTLWVHVRTASIKAVIEAVLRNTHNLCFRAKIRK